MTPLFGRALAVGTIAWAVATGLIPAQQLENDFKNPPEAVKPRTYWYWMDGQITKEGITKDLETMKKVGIGEAYIGVIAGQSPNMPTQGAIKILSEPFWELMMHAVKEGSRLGVDIGVFNSPGWSQSGGPWVKPSQAMRHLVSSELRLHGPQHFVGKAPQGGADFQEVSFMAFPVPKGEDEASLAAFKGTEKRDGSSFTLTLPQAATARSVKISPTGPIHTGAKIEASDDGTTFREIHSFVIDRHNLALNVGPSPLAPIVIGFPETTAKVFRVVVSSPSDLGGVKISGMAVVDAVAEKSLEKVFQDPLPPFDFYTWPVRAEAASKDYAVAPESVRDLRKNLAADGTFTWDVPAGDWIVLRTGMVPTGTKNGPAAPEATGYDVDKMHRVPLKAHFEAYIGELYKRLSPAERKSWKHVVEDSYEVGPENWTDGFDEDFRNHYGYEPMRFLPVLTGRQVGSAEQSDRFLWDMRRLVADRVATEYVGGLRDLCHEKGLKMWLENYGHWGFPGEFLLYGGNSDEISGEYWEAGALGTIELRDASSAAHIYGKREVWAESWTGGPQFRSTPWSLKKRGDWSLCEGINAVMFHLYIHQPWDDKKPGVSAPFGTEFNRNNTWFGMAGSWIQYLQRCCFMLQQGLHAADVAYFIGEDAPKMSGSRRPELPHGYDYDYINGDVLLNKAKVENGRLVLPDGMSFRVLVLPPSETMRPELLEKIKSFVDGGLTVFGPLPVRSPSLQGYPACDEKVRELSAALKGKVLDGTDLTGALKVPADIGNLPEHVLFTHRHTAGEEIYFLSNQEDAPVTFDAGFRVSGKVPEFWHPDTGETERPASEPGDGVVKVPVRLDGGGSLFVVFREKSALQVMVPKTGDLRITKAVYEAVDGAGSLDVTERLNSSIVEGHLGIVVNNSALGKDPALQHAKQLRVEYVLDGKPGSATLGEENILSLSSGTEITGPWNVQFANRKITFDRLGSWTDRPEPDIKYYSGEATYRTTFQKPAVSANGSTLIDLGAVGSLAEVTVNGHTFPTLWKPPYRLDIGSALKPGANELAIRVVNVWHNRLLGQKLGVQGIGEDKVWTNTGIGYPANDPLIPAGLIGPVKLPTLEAKH